MTDQQSGWTAPQLTARDWDAVRLARADAKRRRKAGRRRGIALEAERQARHLAWLRGPKGEPRSGVAPVASPET